MLLPTQQPLGHDVTSHTHEPPEHRSPLAQVFPHDPQFFESVAMSAQVPLQFAVPEGHTHVPAPVVLLQVMGAVHVPQLAAGQLVPSDAEPQTFDPHADLLQPPHVPGLPLQVPEPEAHVPQFCVAPQSSTNEPHVAWSELHVILAVQEHVPPAPLAPLQIFGDAQLPQLGVLPQLSLKEPHA